MPFVNVKLVEGANTEAEKREMIEKITDVMASIEGENMRPYVWVLIEEVKSGQWGAGGNPVTAEALKALRSG